MICLIHVNLASNLEYYRGTIEVFVLTVPYPWSSHSRVLGFKYGTPDARVDKTPMKKKKKEKWKNRPESKETHRETEEKTPRIKSNSVILILTVLNKQKGKIQSKIKPYGPGSKIPLLDPGAYLLYMLLEHHAFKHAPGAYLLYALGALYIQICFWSISNLEYYSRLFMLQDHMLLEHLWLQITPNHSRLLLLQDHMVLEHIVLDH